MNSNVELSIVVPIYNEEESLPFLVNQLLEVLKPMANF
jgi:glycosyltransferase involved in cell wall biosynthesis